MTFADRVRAFLQPTEDVAKASTGIGAFWMTNQPQLSTFAKDPSKAMAMAQSIGMENIIIRMAERAIGERFSTVEWHLVGKDEEPITEGPVVDLLERPYTPAKGDPVNSTPKTRSALWRITSRHLGLCGNAFWYLDQTAALDGWPLQIIYINPARMTPAEDSHGNLLDWVLDGNAYGGGTPLGLDNLLHFKLEPADYGHWGVGLVESAFSRAELIRLADRHGQGVLASGGRLAGVFSPPAAADAIPEEQYDQLKLDIRNIAEAPDAARRSLILRGPIDFKPTAVSPSDLGLAMLSALGQDGILKLWGVPESQLGGKSDVSGLNSGSAKAAEEAVFWQNGVGPRLRSFGETIQFGLLDRLADAPQLVIEEPEFDDEEPRYELASKAASQPLTNAERRDILGLEPTGDEAFDNAIWLPFNLANVWTVGTGGEMIAEKARTIPGVDRVRQRMTSKIRSGVTRVLDRMKADVSAKVERNAAHLAANPNDDSIWWDSKRWDAELLGVLKPEAAFAAERTVEKTSALLGQHANANLWESIVEQMLPDVGSRITGTILDTTRAKVRESIATGIADGLGAAELGKVIEASAGFAEYRAELIARTETNRLLNGAQLESFKAYDVQNVQAIDGDEDAECATRNGQIYTVAEAANIFDHPNGTLDWAPLTLTQEPI